MASKAGLIVPAYACTYVVPCKGGAALPASASSQCTAAQYAGNTKENCKPLGLACRLLGVPACLCMCMHERFRAVFWWLEGNSLFVSPVTRVLRVLATARLHQRERVNAVRKQRPC